MLQPADSSTPEHAEQQALMGAVQALMLPLARLVVARGVAFGEVEEALKRAMIQAAREAALQAKPDALPHRLVSRISTATGINRREVTRLVDTRSDVRPPRRPLAVEVYAHWLSDPRYRDHLGQPSPLPRQGVSLSFESLAREITSDVHPRSLLDDMLRLGYARLSESGDQVEAVPDAFVASGDVVRSYQILGSNIGDHLSGAVANVLGNGRQHFDQAIVADGLTDASMDAVRKLIVGQWRAVFDHLVPALERLISADREQRPEAERQRVLIGLYSFNQAQENAAPGDQPADES